MGVRVSDPSTDLCLGFRVQGLGFTVSDLCADLGDFKVSLNEDGALDLIKNRALLRGSWFGGLGLRFQLFRGSGLWVEGFLR